MESGTLTSMPTRTPEGVQGTSRRRPLAPNPAPAPAVARKLFLALFLTLTLLVPRNVSAQHQHSPYVGMDVAEGTTLTPEEIQQLRDGEGMRQALPAELNRYPGPKHALELADGLVLDDGQRSRLQEIFQDMHRAAVDLGEEIITTERHLAGAFSAGEATPDRIASITGHIAELRGRLRATHLVAHVATRSVLTDAQVERYQELRGYR